MKRRSRQKWLTLEDADYVICIPDPDEKPHGNIKVAKTKYKLAYFDCPCHPQVISGDHRGIFEKPVILHNSFRDMAQINKSIEIICPTDAQ